MQSTAPPEPGNLSPDTSAPTDKLLAQQLSSLLAPSPFEEDDKDLGYLSRSYSPGSEKKYGGESPNAFQKTQSESPPEDRQVLSSRLFDRFSRKPKRATPPDSPSNKSPTAEIQLLPKQSSYENSPTLPKSHARDTEGLPPLGADRPAIARFPYLVRTYDLGPKKHGFSSEDYEESRTISLSPSPQVKKPVESPVEDDQPLSAEKLREASKQLFGHGGPVHPPKRTATPLEIMDPVPIPDKPVDDKAASDAEAVNKLLLSRHPRAVKVIHIKKRKQRVTITSSLA